MRVLQGFLQLHSARIQGFLAARFKFWSAHARSHCLHKGDADFSTYTFRGFSFCTFADFQRQYICGCISFLSMINIQFISCDNITVRRARGWGARRRLCPLRRHVGRIRGFFSSLPPLSFTALFARVFIGLSIFSVQVGLKHFLVPCWGVSRPPSLMTPGPW